MQLRLPVLPAMTAVSVQPVKKLAGTSASVTSSAARLSAARRGEPGSRSMASQGDGIHVADVDEPRLVAHARHGNHKVAAPGEYFELLNLHGTEYWMAQLRHPLLSQRLDIALDLALIRTRGPSCQSSQAPAQGARQSPHQPYVTSQSVCFANRLLVTCRFATRA